MKLKERSEDRKRALMQAEPRLPFAVQHQKAPGLESKLKPRPRYEAARYRPAGTLENKVALITGGDSGIGRAVAILFAREGADAGLRVPCLGRRLVLHHRDRP